MSAHPPMTDFPCLFQLRTGAIWGQRPGLEPTPKLTQDSTIFVAEWGKYLSPRREYLCRNFFREGVFSIDLSFHQNIQNPYINHEGLFCKFTIVFCRISSYFLDIGPPEKWPPCLTQFHCLYFLQTTALENLGKDKFFQMFQTFGLIFSLVF